MDEHRLAQVVLDALTQDPGQIDEREYKAGLEQLENAIDHRQADDSRRVAHHNALVDDLGVQEREERVNSGGQGNRDDEANGPRPVRADEAQNAFEHRRS